MSDAQPLFISKPPDSSHGIDSKDRMPDSYPPLQPNMFHDAHEMTHERRIPSFFSTLGQFYDDQVLLGLVVLNNPPKPAAPLLANQLLSSGIRFVHFCTANEKTTHNLGEQLGLFTGFNHYISLRPPEVNSEHELFLGTSRVPRGMAALRHHLNQIDNIPLLVSLFSDSTDTTVAQYMRVANESNERLISLMSSYGSEIHSSVLLADCVISQPPMTYQECAFNDFQLQQYERFEELYWSHLHMESPTRAAPNAAPNWSRDDVIPIYEPNNVWVFPRWDAVAQSLQHAWGDEWNGSPRIPLPILASSNIPLGSRRQYRRLYHSHPLGTNYNTHRPSELSFLDNKLLIIQSLLGPTNSACLQLYYYGQDHHRRPSPNGSVESDSKRLLDFLQPREVMQSHQLNTLATSLHLPCGFELSNLPVLFASAKQQWHATHLAVLFVSYTSCLLLFMSTLLFLMDLPAVMGAIPMLLFTVLGLPGLALGVIYYPSLFLSSSTRLANPLSPNTLYSCSMDSSLAPEAAHRRHTSSISRGPRVSPTSSPRNIGQKTWSPSPYAAPPGFFNDDAIQMTSLEQSRSSANGSHLARTMPSIPQPWSDPQPAPRGLNHLEYLQVLPHAILACNTVDDTFNAPCLKSGELCDIMVNTEAVIPLFYMYPPLSDEDYENIGSYNPDLVDPVFPEFFLNTPQYHHFNLNLPTDSKPLPIEGHHYRQHLPPQQQPTTTLTQFQYKERREEMYRRFLRIFRPIVLLNTLIILAAVVTLMFLLCHFTSFEVAMSPTIVSHNSIGYSLHVRSPDGSQPVHHGKLSIPNYTYDTHSHWPNVAIFSVNALHFYQSPSPIMIRLIPSDTPSGNDIDQVVSLSTIFAKAQPGYQSALFCIQYITAFAFVSYVLMIALVILTGAQHPKDVFLAAMRLCLVTFQQCICRLRITFNRVAFKLHRLCSTQQHFKSNPLRYKRILDRFIRIYRLERLSQKLSSLRCYNSYHFRVYFPFLVCLAAFYLVSLCGAVWQALSMNPMYLPLQSVDHGYDTLNIGPLVVVLLFPIVWTAFLGIMFVINHSFKAKIIATLVQDNTRLGFEFDTQLGMYSPVGL